MMIVPRQRWFLGGALASAALAGLLFFALDAARAPHARAEEKKPLAEVMKRMKYYNKALGVECDYCHVMPDRFEVETPRKKTARWMQEKLVDRLEMRGTKEPIDCHTCHDGRARFLPSSQ